MARKIQVKLIMELRSAGMSQRSIAVTWCKSRPLAHMCTLVLPRLDGVFARVCRTKPTA